MPGAGSAGRSRARGEVLAERVNAAADLLERGVPTASAARQLAQRCGCSVGAHGGAGPAAVFTVRLPVPLIARVRARAAATGQTLSAVVAQALENS